MLERIEAPALICGSFSDHNLHSRGSFEAFRRIASPYKWLYTHRGGKWATYYSPEALDFQARFFDCFLKGEENGMRAVLPVRLEVRETGDRVHEVRHEAAWPLPQTKWVPLHLHADGALREVPAVAPGGLSFEARRGRASFAWTVPADVEVTGPMRLRLHLEVRQAADFHLFAGIRKLRGGRHIVFEGSYGFGCDMISHGWLQASLRRLTEPQAEPWRPAHPYDVKELLKAGQIVSVELELLPSTTLFRRGDVLRLDVQGHWFFRKDPLFGQFPAGYESSPPGTALLHCGGIYDASLLIPTIPASPRHSP